MVVLNLMQFEEPYFFPFKSQLNLVDMKLNGRKQDGRVLITDFAIYTCFVKLES